MEVVVELLVLIDVVEVKVVIISIGWDICDLINTADSPPNSPNNDLLLQQLDAG